MTNKEKIEIINSIQIVVTYISDERLSWIKKQIDDLNILIDVYYFKGFTPADSKGYILEKHPDFGYAEIDGQICCTRSFAGAIKWFVDNCPEKKYLITLEDDSCFIKNGFINNIINTIESYKKVEDNVDYVSLGYLPFDINIISNFPNIDNLYYDIWKGTTVRNAIPHKVNESLIWGNQMTLFSKKSAEEVSDILHQENTDLVRYKIKERMEKGFVYSNRASVLITDHCTPSIFRQSIVYPPMAIEGDFYTLMGQDNNNLKLESHNWSKYIDISNYSIN